VNREYKECPAPRSHTITYRWIRLSTPLLSHRTLPLSIEQLTYTKCTPLEYQRLQGTTAPDPSASIAVYYNEYIILYILQLQCTICNYNYVQNSVSMNYFSILVSVRVHS